jgi:hypothetical protein
MPESENVTTELKLTCVGMLSEEVISVLGGWTLSLEQEYNNKQFTMNNRQ